MAEHKQETYAQRAEKLNGRLAMLGFVIAVGTYLTTGQIIPGLW
ncbi:MAG: high light inducible protein [Caulobacteraceae bacterium]|nr:high light inducible protein [Caulobacteraceae bacterium]